MTTTLPSAAVEQSCTQSNQQSRTASFFSCATRTATSSESFRRQPLSQYPKTSFLVHQGVIHYMPGGGVFASCNRQTVQPSNRATVRSSSTFWARRSRFLRMWKSCSLRTVHRTNLSEPERGFSPLIPHLRALTECVGKHLHCRCSGYFKTKYHQSLDRAHQSNFRRGPDESR